MTTALNICTYYNSIYNTVLELRIIRWRQGMARNCKSYVQEKCVDAHTASGLLQYFWRLPLLEDKDYRYTQTQASSFYSFDRVKWREQAPMKHSPFSSSSTSSCFSKWFQRSTDDKYDAFRQFTKGRYNSYIALYLRNVALVYGCKVIFNRPHIFPRLRINLTLSKSN
jgi:hypothetical protein